MKIGKTENYINQRLGESGALLFMLIDPVDYKSTDAAIQAGVKSAQAGADVLLIGGSIGAQGELLDEVSVGIKDHIKDVPIVLFPGNIATITRHADAVYFMSLLNARNPYWITQAQMLAAPLIRHMKIEPLPVGYIVVEPGGTVGWVGDVNLVPRAKPKIAGALANAGEFLGNRFIVTDAGSNPQLQNLGPIPSAIISEVKKSITVPYIVGGGIKTSEQQREIYRAGADIVQIGAILEETRDTKKTVEQFVKVAREEGKKKL
ncbi:MAG: geranylgeranylglyceryl/heptaprenylglyceryl phosphate synthase [Candidatus Micrarchaeota archaeon]|nr:geranylgeranylglyceryl/heptaprenylglyceryl phosphate synthase [Candidatus Micrarchaeota archaeon]MDE1847625.1 geranylgeranylglyceryl/heptaprenylglyceryl phosphate synthase [Candidatus Micrarchaeota archaeon]MDE1863828.1 geranylgeranylglyceryl/heptaprenylglyceryl phosphate synthase [Candidatus Micrarchaeota archaeon]